MNKYTVALARLFDLEDKEYPCYFILKDWLPEFLINKWLESKGKRSLQTSRQYTYNYGEISRLKVVIVAKEIKINELESSQKEFQNKYEILLGQLHQITKKARLKGIDL